MNTGNMLTHSQGGGMPVETVEAQRWNAEPLVTDGDQYADSTVRSDVALLDSLPKEQQELAVTRMLDQSKQWLDRAMEATNPARAVSEFKAFVATVAEASKQKKLSEGIQLDAVEMVRRAERALGVAIRKGQDAGEILRRGQGGGWGSSSRNEREEDPASPNDFARKDELTNSFGGIYDMTDGVSDDQFEAVIAEAKEEGNMSRRNIVRKIKGTSSAPVAPAPTSDKSEQLRRLAEIYPTAGVAFEKEGHRTHSSAKTLNDAVVRAGLKWRYTAPQWNARAAKSRDVLDRSSMAIETALSAITQIVDMQTITTEQAEEALERLDRNTLNLIIKQLKEISNV